ncbi:MAG: GNAT family N-acetyltransferase [Berryella intestinalis]|uniref:GCN5 family acetyltransferase n=1 Tax=Berryella intestinalis TaxID=1531429 RepID=A0A0A8B5P9_9ACTN|nr:GNAT family N-acetyltransferase [Berryella intestinalis]AJC12669.1 GCN5 family acetyltransferase [Berryella intestinalis]MDD7368747.1 GNAT family N-acetyltransferase [Berryella intestinalis]MDY3128746.1 GNAT family N-acetyltransferase [Berryella intestinalis]
MATEFKPVRTEAQQETLAKLAEEIWLEYWPALIGEDQARYMIDRFQSLDAIRRDMAAPHHAYEYWLVVDPDLDPAPTDERPWGSVVGYTGGYSEPETNRFFISKIYLLDSARGRGHARKTIEHYDELSRQRGHEAMYLTVNKGNVLGIRAYEGTGFKTIEAVVNDIGRGFVMDDYVMERPVETR